MSTKIYAILLCSMMLLTAECKDKKNKDQENESSEEIESSENPIYHVNHVVGVDHFGRSFDVIAPLREDRKVGMFFWPWMSPGFATDVYDATKILAMPNGLNLLTSFDYHDPNISPNGEAHWWGEPIWGYYSSQDEWVIRKQIQMITFAGVDFIFFDVTNTYIYTETFMKVLAVIDEYLKNGWNPPKIAFYTHSRSFQTTRELYRVLYQPNLYPDTWYRMDGKPMIIAYTDLNDDLAEAEFRGDDSYHPEPLSNEILNFFHFKKPQWPGNEWVGDPVFPDGLPWIEWAFPQPMHGTTMNVTVASHPGIPFSFSLTRGWTNWGRGWNPDIRKNVCEDVDKGTFFQRQWDWAIHSKPKMITVGGWNEWIGFKQPHMGEYMLCDAVNKEYSRDIEPMKGGYQDAFYLQLIRNIRNYKGTATEHVEQGEQQTIQIPGDIAQWEKVSNSIANIGSNDIARRSQGAAKTVFYVQKAPENLLQEVKVVNDGQNVYFYIRCKNKFTAPQDRKNWLNILIGTGYPELKAWESYDYIIGRSFHGQLASVEKLNADFSASSVGSANFQLDGNTIQLQIPLSIVGDADRFYFKVAAGVDKPSDIMSYYTSGSVMPMGRLSYYVFISK